MENLRLATGAHLHCLLTPIGDRRLFFSEHTLAGAGGINQYPVEVAGIFFSQPSRVFVGHQGIGNPHSFDVPAENFRPFGVNLVAQKEAFASHSAGNLGGFTTGGGA